MSLPPPPRCPSPHRSAATFLAPLASTALALLAAVGTASCKQESSAPPPPPPIVQVLDLVATNLPLSYELIGQLDSPENVEIRARVEAFVEKILFTEGTDVKAGDPLFQLDKRPFEERLAAARGQLAQAQASLGKYLKDVDRLRPLADKKAIPQQDLDNAVASVEVGRAALVSAEAAVQSATLDVGYCDVRSPIAGRIGAKQVSAGDLVGKGQATLLATISRVEPIWFYCGVSEVAFLRAEGSARTRGKTVADLPVHLIRADGSRHPDPGRFVFVDRAVDPKTGTLRLRAEFPNPGGILRPGMFARVAIDLGLRPDSVVVPERAVAELQGRYFVWVVGPGDQVSQRPVKRADQAVGTAGVLIEDGLKPGERIVVEGLQKVREGATVKPLTAAQLAAAAAAATATPSAAKTGETKSSQPGTDKK